MMLSLGMFVFALESVPYQELRRRESWRHPTSSRVGARPASQFAGPDAASVSLTGWIGPEVCGDPGSLDELRAMGDAGDSYALVAGTGDVLGEYVILDVDDGRTLFFADGAARRIEFTVSLQRVDDAPDTQGEPDDWDTFDQAAAQKTDV